MGREIGYINNILEIVSTATYCNASSPHSWSLNIVKEDKR